MNEARFIAIIYASALLIVGLIQTFIDKFSKKGYILGVNITANENKKEIEKTIKSYRFLTLSLTIVLYMLQYFCIYLTQSIGILSMVFFISLFFLQIPLYVKNNKLRELTKNQNISKKKIIVTNISNRFDKKFLYIGYGLSLLIIIVTSLAIFINYDKLPNRLITHTDFAGNPTSIEDKNYLNVFFPSIISLSLIGLFIFINHIIIKNRTRISKENPKKSVEDAITAKKLWSYYCIVSALSMVILFQIGVNYFTFTGEQTIFTICLILTFVISIGGAIYLGNKVGIDGSRLNNLDKYSFEEDDKYWKFGSIFYYNPDDPALFVNKRIGVGMTINLGKTTGKIIIIASFLIVIISLVMLFKQDI